MATAQQKRDYFRMDMMMPFQAAVVREKNGENLVSSECEASNLKNTILNLSGGGLNFRSKIEFLPGDLLKMILTVPLLIPRTVCLYGKVVKSDRTPKGNFRVRVIFSGITERVRDILIGFIIKHEREVLRSAHLPGYIRFTDVSVVRFLEGTVLPFQIFTTDKGGVRFLFDSGLPYDSLSKEYFEERGISKIYVAEDDISHLDRYLARVRGVKIKPFDREDPLSFKEYSFKKRQLHCIGRRVLLPRTEIMFNLYKIEDYNYSLFLEGSPSIPVMLDDNVPSMPVDFFVKFQEIPLYFEYLKTLPVDATPLALKEKACVLMQDVLDDFRNSLKIASAVETAREIVEHLEKMPDSFYKMLTYDAVDFYPYVHAVDVTVLSVRMALFLSLPKADIDALAIGALFHDVGFGLINDEIVNKQGRLSDAEEEVFKTHVIEGAALIENNETIPKKSLAALLHHHESLAGDGYPAALSGNRISAFGRITAIADDYDQLITQQPFRNRLTPAQALAVMTKDSAKYDPMILAVFIKLIAQQIR